MPARSISTEVEINASCEKVWEVLSNFSTWSEWNPFITSLTCDGPLEEGKKLVAVMKLAERAPATFKPTVLVVAANKELRWRGSLPVPGLFTANHYFTLESQGPSTTKLMHGEDCNGLLIPFVGGILADTEKGFIAMNGALKKRCEATV